MTTGLKISQTPHKDERSRIFSKSGLQVGSYITTDCPLIDLFSQSLASIPAFGHVIFEGTAELNRAV